MKPRWWGVSSPEYDTAQSTPGGYDPPEYGRDWVPVFTHSKRRAKVLAVRHWRRDRYTFVSTYNDENPFAGLEVQELHRCEHGYEWYAQDKCEKCSAWPDDDYFAGITYPEGEEPF